MYCTIESNRNPYMKPDKNSSSRGGTPLLPQRSMAIDLKSRSNDLEKEATAQIILKKIDTLFTEKNTLDEKSSPTEQNPNPYDRTHSDQTDLKTSDWKKYHSAWQDYYQKYYEGYYTHHLSEAKKKLSQGKIDKPLSTKEVESKFRHQLIEKVRSSAENVRKSRHFIPILSGLIVVLVFLFLQYNSILAGNVMAYISPGYIDPQNIVIDPNTSITVGPEPRLIIPKINVDVPVYYDIGNDYSSQMSAMAKGVAHFAVPGASSHPGEVGNTVIAGHSSSDLLSPGDYKFIFVQLEKLNIGDTIYANYNSKRYTYTVTKKEVVGPNDVSKLVYPTAKPIMTLLTCVPIGTADSRLLVTAEQISPAPDQAITKPATAVQGNKSIPGTTPTLLERLFGAKD